MAPRTEVGLAAGPGAGRGSQGLVLAGRYLSVYQMICMPVSLSGHLNTLVRSVCDDDDGKQCPQQSSKTPATPPVAPPVTAPSWSPPPPSSPVRQAPRSTTHRSERPFSPCSAYFHGSCRAWHLFGSVTFRPGSQPPFDCDLLPSFKLAGDCEHGDHSIEHR